MRVYPLCFLVLILSLTQSLANGVGFTRINVDDPMGGKMTVSLWYPTSEPTGITRLGPFLFDASRDAPLKNGKHGLVVLSHGNAGSDLGHRNIAIELARKGFVAAAPLHPRNNFKDNIGGIRRAVMEGRPRQLSAVIDAMLSIAPWRDVMDPQKIGGFGYSLGGYSVLAVLGARPDIANSVAHCHEQQPDPYCSIAFRNKAHTKKLMADEFVLPMPDMIDRRICAAVLADPVAVPFSNIEIVKIKTAAVQIWYPEIQNVLLAEANAIRVADVLNSRPKLPKIETIKVGQAQHYSFLAPFPESVMDSLPPLLTQDEAGFDRRTFQREFAERVSTFLAERLAHCASTNPLQ